MSIDKVDHPKGFAFAIVAYLLWGFLPIYMKALSHVPAAEVVAHRVIWSVPVAMIVLVALRRTSDLKNALRSKRVMGMALLTATLISVNWLTYVYAIATDSALVQFSRGLWCHFSAADGLYLFWSLGMVYLPAGTGHYTGNWLSMVRGIHG